MKQAVPLVVGDGLRWVVKRIAGNCRRVWYILSPSEGCTTHEIARQRDGSCPTSSIAATVSPAARRSRRVDLSGASSTVSQNAAAWMKCSPGRMKRSSNVLSCFVVVVGS
jgi:hypothetical protein